MFEGIVWMKAPGTFSNYATKGNLDADFAELSSTQRFLEGADLATQM